MTEHDLIPVTLKVTPSEAAEWLADFYSWDDLKYMSPDRLQRSLEDTVRRRTLAAKPRPQIEATIRKHLLKELRTEPPPPVYQGATTTGQIPSVFDQDEDGEPLPQIATTTGEFQPMETVT